MNKKTYILGGGSAGLAAGWRLSKKGKAAEIIELSNRPGGLAGGVEINGNIYEYGPHLFHTTDTEILNDVKSLMGQDLMVFHRTVKVKFMGKLFDFPLSVTDVISKLPLKTVASSFFSLVFYSIRSMLVKPKVENTETVLLGNYGKILYEIFFKSYIEQVWGIPPANFSPDFARQRIPRMNFLEIMERFVKYFSRSKTEKMDTEQFVEKTEGDIFTTRRGFSMIAERIMSQIESLGGTVRLNTSAKQLNIADNRIESIKTSIGKIEEIVECDHVISTLPLGVLVKLAYPAPPKEVQEAAARLKYRATVFVGTVVRRKPVLPASFMYYREISFNRIMDLGYFGIDINPEDATILIAEVNCETSDFIWIEENHAKEMVINDLVKEGLLDKNEILETHVFKAPHAYPIYLLNYEKDLKVLFDWVDSIKNLQTIGRQGRFQYINSHVAMKMGYNAADAIISEQKQTRK